MSVLAALGAVVALGVLVFVFLFLAFADFEEIDTGPGGPEEQDS